jgi:cobalamin biosynthesis protein CobW
VIKTSCNLLTGFLGTGKTTLLTYIMQHGLQNKRVALVMNEIGDIGIDDKVITGLADPNPIVDCLKAASVACDAVITMVDAATFLSLSTPMRCWMNRSKLPISWC